MHKIAYERRVNTCEPLDLDMVPQTEIVDPERDEGHVEDHELLAQLRADLLASDERRPAPSGRTLWTRLLMNADRDTRSVLVRLLCQQKVALIRGVVNCLVLALKSATMQSRCNAAETLIQIGEPALYALEHRLRRTRDVALQSALIAVLIAMYPKVGFWERLEIDTTLTLIHRKTKNLNVFLVASKALECVGYHDRALVLASTDKAAMVN